MTSIKLKELIIKDINWLKKCVKLLIDRKIRSLIKLPVIELLKFPWKIDKIIERGMEMEIELKNVININKMSIVLLKIKLESE